MTQVHPIPSRATAPTPRPIVVGVGPEEMESALEFAVLEAIRADCGLHLVHAVPLLPSTPDTTMLSGVDVVAWGRETLDLAVKRAADLADGMVTVTSELLRGTPVQVLVEVGRTARMVVLEHRHLSRLARVATRTVAGGVSAHLRAPVVAVPSGWTRPEGEPFVVAGVDVPERSEEVLASAVAESRSRGAALRIVHSWALPVHHAGMVVETPEHRRWNDRSRAEVRAALDGLGDASVAIDAEVVVQPGRAIEAILEVSQGAELLVIGRHDPLVPIGSHIGPVARAVLREATCPVLLASPRAHAAAYHP